MKAAISEVRFAYSPQPCCLLAFRGFLLTCFPTGTLHHRPDGTLYGRGDGTVILKAVFRVCKMYSSETGEWYSSTHLHSYCSLGQTSTADTSVHQQLSVRQRSISWEARTRITQFRQIAPPCAAWPREDPSLSYRSLLHLLNGSEPQLSTCVLRTPRIHEAKMLSW